MAVKLGHDFGRTPFGIHQVAAFARGPLGGNAQAVPAGNGYPLPAPTVDGTKVSSDVGSRR